jgi:hypothetical protein
LAFALLIGALGGPASAQDAPEKDKDAPEQGTAALLETLAMAPDPADVSPAPDDPFAAVVDADAAVAKAADRRIRALTRSTEANAAAQLAAKARDAAYAKALVAQKVRDDASKELSIERKRLADLTVRAYVTGGEVDIEKYREILQGDTSDPAAGRQIIFGQVMERQKRVTTKARTDLGTAKRRLAKAKAKLAAATAESERRTARAEDLAAKLADAVAEHQEAVQDAADARTDLRSAASRPLGLAPLDIPLIGLPRLTAEDLAGWFARSAYRPRVSTPIEDYARWFIEEGQAEGIRGDVAFAQAVLETGGFANTDSVVANNFSGIGHCDLCPSGWTFGSPRLGVRAQIQLLKSYAIKKPQYASDLVDKRLRGPAGCCPTWGDLTTVWATDPGYGPKVMFIYTSLVDYALQRRAAGQGMETTAPTP